MMNLGMKKNYETIELMIAVVRMDDELGHGEEL